MKTLVAILAAGESSRFGGRKQFADIHGQPLLQRAQNTVLRADLADCEHCVVVGAFAQEVSTLVKPPFSVVNNPNWQNGIGASIKCAVNEAIERQCSHLLLVLGDQLALTEDDIQLLHANAIAHPDSLICAKYENTLGVPAIFPADRFAQLIAIDDKKGAKCVIHDNQYARVEVALERAKHDLDTQEALRCWTMSVVNNNDKDPT
ncbi:nucleotidyltransferase family protein [Aestuariibacter sp. AA17]|uniref:Nucleotidyltransferase family protein n=1 Tax=Fluctibacter corallii TaxID=2984329 RepID=A0ABT3A9M9_9ALTE|nr:nucleotidyltransferase family protein [Aestuariibacter sp. AA17]MCV2885387.1 nucleotidyltransferase family protein [Aestuariibacter sp. AA17]